MGVKLLSNYPVKQFVGISIPNVEMTFRGEFKQEKDGNQYILSSCCYVYSSSDRASFFETIPYRTVSEQYQIDPLTYLYNKFKTEKLGDYELQDI